MQACATQPFVRRDGGNLALLQSTHLEEAVHVERALCAQGRVGGPGGKVRGTLRVASSMVATPGTVEVGGVAKLGVDSVHHVGAEEVDSDLAAATEVWGVWQAASVVPG